MTETQTVRIELLADGIYKVFVKSNNKPIGIFISDLGTYYYEPIDTKGLWSDYALIEIGTLLKKVNEL